jgi:FlaA1/EpsC-like NDP-sugar epimerase
MEYIVPSKLRLDQLYVRNRSFWLDLDVLLWTSLVLLPAAGAYQPPEAVLFWGPVSKLVRRYLTWFTVDTLVTLTAVGLAGVFWRFFVVLNVGWERSAMIALSFALLFSLSGALFGIHKVAWSKANAEEAMDLLPPVLFAGLIAYFGNLFFNPTPLPRGMVVLASALALAGFGLVRYRGRLLSGLASRWLGLRGGAHLARERVLIVGGGESGQVAAWLLSQRRADNAMWVVGFVDDDLYKQGVRIQGSRVLGKCADIPHLLKQFDVGVVVFAIHNILSEERARLLEACRRPGIRLVEVPDVLALLRGTGRG